MSNKIVFGLGLTIILLLMASIYPPVVNAAPAVLNVPADFPTVADALAVAADGDIINFTDDVFDEAPVVIDVNVTINGNGFSWIIEPPGAVAEIAVQVVNTTFHPTAVSINNVTIIPGGEIIDVIFTNANVLNLSGIVVDTTNMIFNFWTFLLHGVYNNMNGSLFIDQLSVFERNVSDIIHLDLFDGNLDATVTDVFVEYGVDFFELDSWNSTLWMFMSDIYVEEIGWDFFIFDIEFFSTTSIYLGDSYLEVIGDEVIDLESDPVTDFSEVYITVDDLFVEYSEEDLLDLAVYDRSYVSAEFNDVTVLIEDWDEFFEIDVYNISILELEINDMWVGYIDEEFILLDAYNNSEVYIWIDPSFFGVVGDEFIDIDMRDSYLELYVENVSVLYSDDDALDFGLYDGAVGYYEFRDLNVSFSNDYGMILTLGAAADYQLTWIGGYLNSSDYAIAYFSGLPGLGLINLTDVAFNETDIFFGDPALSVYTEWNMEVLVVDVAGTGIENIFVEIYDVNGLLIDSGNTDVNGRFVTRIGHHITAANFFAPYTVVIYVAGQAVSETDIMWTMHNSELWGIGPIVFMPMILNAQGRAVLFDPVTGLVRGPAFLTIGAGGGELTVISAVGIYNLNFIIDYSYQEPNGNIHIYGHFFVDGIRYEVSVSYFVDTNRVILASKIVLFSGFPV
jgi:hypothetical protein